MQDISEFFQHLLNTDSWPPRWLCGTWSDFHGWLYIASDMITWLAYFIIPVILIWFVQKRPHIPFLPVVWLFAIFIILCGLTHFFDVLMFWWPAYRLNALVRFFTAVISIFTVFALIRDLPRVLDPTFENLDVSDEGLSKSEKIELLSKQVREQNAIISSLKQKLGEKE
ncbi:MAG: hypothetical protein ACPF8V_06445 [Luteibaculum sp.]